MPCPPQACPTPGQRCKSCCTAGTTATPQRLTGRAKVVQNPAFHMPPRADYDLGGPPSIFALFTVSMAERRTCMEREREETSMYNTSLR